MKLIKKKKPKVEKKPDKSTQQPKNNKKVEEGLISEERARDIGVQALRWAFLSANPVPDAWRYGKKLGGIGQKLVIGVSRGGKTAYVPFRNIYLIFSKRAKPGRPGEYVDENSSTVYSQFMRGELTDKDLVEIGVRSIKTNHILSFSFGLLVMTGFSLAAMGVGWQTIFGVWVLTLFAFVKLLESWSIYMKILKNKDTNGLGYMKYFLKRGEFREMIPVITDPKRLEKRIMYLVKKKEERQQKKGETE